jgi:glutathione S-transferase
MILIGQYDSPFVRRVGIALRLYGLPFEHRPWSVFGDGDRIRAINPLMRVPTVVLDGGDVLVDSASILDHLDSLVPAGNRLIPQVEPARRRALRVMALAMGLGDKAVSLFYEYRLHEVVSEVWAGRCRTQMGAVLAALEAECAVRPGPWWFGDPIGHADIAVACVLRFVGEVHGDLFTPAAYPALTAFCGQAEGLEVFREISQPFVAPA